MRMTLAAATRSERIEAEGPRTYIHLARTGGVMVVTLGLVLSACGSSSAASHKKQSKNAVSASTEIRRDWVKFFSGKTSATEKIKLLQNGQQFAPVIKAESNSPFAKGAGATVSKVKLVSATRANVVYTITISGQPVLKNQTGVAVRQNNVWKVGIPSFCSLLGLEKVSVPACPKARG